jgi:hypothetical protein
MVTAMLRYGVGFGCLLMVLALWACSGVPTFVARDEPWRAEEEKACLASGLVRETDFVTARSALGGPSVCGALKPFKVAATVRGAVALDPPALLRCPMVHALEHWVERVVVPAAHFHLGSEVVGVKVLSSYACRPMNNVDGALLSEHGHANAVDIAAFFLADGRTVTLTGGWEGTPSEQRFLRAAHRGACSVFTTVLSPDYDSNHHDHFHLDLARHREDGRICK